MDGDQIVEQQTEPLIMAPPPMAAGATEADSLVPSQEIEDLIGRRAPPEVPAPPAPPTPPRPPVEVHTREPASWFWWVVGTVFVGIGILYCVRAARRGGTREDSPPA